MSNITDYGVYAADKAPPAQRLSPSSSDTQSHYITVLVMALLSGKVALKVRANGSESAVYTDTSIPTAFIFIAPKQYCNRIDHAFIITYSICLVTRTHWLRRHNMDTMKAWMTISITNALAQRDDTSVQLLLPLLLK